MRPITATDAEEKIVEILTKNNIENPRLISPLIRGVLIELSLDSYNRGMDDMKAIIDKVLD